MHTAADARQIMHIMHTTRAQHCRTVTSCGLRLIPSPGAIPNRNENERNKGETNE